MTGCLEGNRLSFFALILHLAKKKKSGIAMQLFSTTAAKEDTSAGDTGNGEWEMGLAREWRGKENTGRGRDRDGNGNHHLH